jgi:hypothetical protein
MAVLTVPPKQWQNAVAKLAMRAEDFQTQQAPTQTRRLSKA